ncbi:MAG: hypothetical protein ACOYNO_02860 [Saprospiraceae bacterium]
MHRFFTLLLVFPYSLAAQYEAILHDPNVVWAAEITTDYDVEPACQAYGQKKCPNSSVLLKLTNQTEDWILPEHLYLHMQLYDKLENPEAQVFFPADAQNPLTTSALHGRVYRMDTVVTFDPETYEETVKIYRSDVVPLNILRIRVKQLLFLRKNASDFELYTAAYAPLFLENGVWSPIVWYKTDPFSGNKEKTPKITDPKITWARRLRTGTNAPALDQSAILKQIGPSPFALLLDNAANNKQFKVTNEWDSAPLDTAVIRQLLTRQDTLIKYTVYEDIAYIEERRITAADVTGIALEQDWLWDDKRKQLQFTLRSYAPVVDEKDDDGRFLNRQALFWRRVGGPDKSKR